MTYREIKEKSEIMAYLGGVEVRIDDEAVRKLIAIIEGQRAALRWYGDKENYAEWSRYNDPIEPRVNRDFGELARETLKLTEEE